MTLNPANQTATIRPGDKIDKFEVLEQLGAGGMSVVWKGYDRLLDRFVVLKQLLPGGVAALPGAGAADAESLRERFRSEADLHKRVSQDNRHIVRVLDFLDDARGLFIVMEFVDGSSLESVLASQGSPLDERRALGVVAATAVALEVIHDFGILHRDLKPSNILLPRNGGLKVTDFGLATLVAEQDVMTLGSVRYMAPELFSDSPADARADIYALGMIAYEMLAGRAKFEEAFKIVLRDQRNQGVRWMKWHTNLRAKAPALTQLNPAISPTLADLVARMMEKDASLRIASAPELLAAIRRHFAGDTDAAPGADGTPGGGGGKALVRIGRVNPTGIAGPDSPKLPAGARAVPGVIPGVIPGVVPGAGATAAEATAPLPRRRRMVNYLLAALAAEILVFAAIYFVRETKKESVGQEHRDTVRRTMEKAGRLLKDNHLGEARAEYLKLIDQWKSDPTTAAQVTQANALALLCQAALDVDDAKFDVALKEADDAWNTSTLADWGDQVKNVRSRARHGISFRQLVAQINEQISQEKYADAMHSVRDARDLIPTEDEEKQINELDTKIHGLADQKRTDAEVTRVLGEAADMVKHDHRDQAIALLNDTYARYHSPRTQQYADQLTRQISYEQAVNDGKSAEDAGNLSAAIDADTRALALKPDADLTAKVKDLRSRQALEEGRRLLDGGDKVGAAAAFERSIQAKDTPEARTALKQIAMDQQREVHLRAAQDAERNGDFASAIAQYQKTLESGPDAEVSKKLDGARARVAVKEGTDALGQGKLDDAAKDLKIARDCGAELPEVKKAIDDLDHAISYQRHLEAGDALRKQSKYGEASTEYRKARDIMQTKEITGRLDDTEFDHLLAQARSYMDNQQWASAKAQAMSASRIRNTEDVRKLLDEIRSHEGIGGNEKGQ